MNVALDLALRGLRQHLRAPGWVAARATLALLLMFAVVVTAAGRGAVGASGLDLFSALVTIDFLFLAAIAIGPSSSALAEEREGDTLGVLQLAGLSPGAILFAKAGGLFASTMLLLVVQVPFATLATVLGGIDARQVATVFVLLLSTLFGAQGIALACAASAPNTRIASQRSGAAVLGWLLGPAVAVEVEALTLGATGVGAPATSTFGVLRKLSPLDAALDALALQSPPLFPVAAWLGLASGVAGLAFAVRLLRRGPARATTGREGGARRPRPAHLRSGAVRWKEEQFLLGGPAGRRRRTVAYAALLCLLGLLTFDPRGGWLLAWGQLGIWTFLAIGLVEAGIAASHLYRDELRERTLFGLALLPLPPRTWALAKAHGAISALRAPRDLLLASLLLVALGRPVFLPGLVFGAGLFAMVGVLVVYLTLYLSLRLPRGAFIAASGIVLPPVALVAYTNSLLLFCGAFYIVPIAVVAAVSSLQVAIGRRVRELATRY